MKRSWRERRKRITWNYVEKQLIVGYTEMRRNTDGRKTWYMCVSNEIENDIELVLLTLWNHKIISMWAQHETKTSWSSSEMKFTSTFFYSYFSSVSVVSPNSIRVDITHRNWDCRDTIKPINSIMFYVM